MTFQAENFKITMILRVKIVNISHEILTFSIDSGLVLCYIIKAPTARLGVNFLRRKIMRNRITLECTECKSRNYDTFKNKKNDPDRLTFSKYCPTCKKHTAHKESK